MPDGDKKFVGSSSIQAGVRGNLSSGDNFPGTVVNTRII